MKRQQLTEILVKVLAKHKAWERNDALVSILKEYDRHFDE